MSKRNESFDPKLKEAVEEFKALCKKYDCMASVVFVSPSHAEYFYQVETSWGVTKSEGAGVIRFRSKKEDYINKEAQHKATETTVHAFTTFLQFGRKLQSDFDGIIRQLGHHMKIAYSVWED